MGRIPFDVDAHLDTSVLTLTVPTHLFKEIYLTHGAVLPFDWFGRSSMVMFAAEYLSARLTRLWISLGFCNLSRLKLVKAIVVATVEAAYRHAPLYE